MKYKTILCNLIKLLSKPGVTFIWQKSRLLLRHATQKTSILYPNCQTKIDATYMFWRENQCFWRQNQKPKLGDFKFGVSALPTTIEISGLHRLNEKSLVSAAVCNVE